MVIAVSDQPDEVQGLDMVAGAAVGMNLTVGFQRGASDGTRR